MKHYENEQIFEDLIDRFEKSKCRMEVDTQKRYRKQSKRKVKKWNDFE